MTSPANVYRSVFLLLAVLVAGCDSADPTPELGANLTSAAFQDGRRIYRDGVLPSGDPVTAIVAGDVQVLGTQFSCRSCHGQSGMGAAEGNYIVPPIAGQFLFAPSPQPARPAYSQESLARLLREGVTAGGRQLGELMPLYDLTDDEIEAMTVYLAALSSSESPGVDDNVIRFAIVITDDVAAEEREAVLAVFNTFIGEKNRNTRLESERWDRGSTPSSRLKTTHRDWVLEEWVLTGPSATWDKQLEQHYRDKPVFALLGGLSNQSWRPVSRFCERNEIPCLFPGTDLPAAEAGDFYTLYYSRGIKLEAALIADHLASQPVSRVVQVFCESRLAAAADGFRSLIDGTGVVVDDISFDCDQGLPAGTSESTAASTETAIILWLSPEYAASVANSLPAGRLYLSSILSGGLLDNSLPSFPGPAFMAHSFRLPGQSDPAMTRFSIWAKTRGIELSAPRRQSEAFFACLALKDAVAHMGRFFVRDFVLDTLDHAQSLAAYLPVYPRPTLGPRQRFLNKGGYVLPVVDGQVATQNADWILP